MKVLFINTVYGKGSTGRLIQNIGEALENAGHSFKVAYGRGNIENDRHVYKIGNVFDTYIHASLARITDKVGSFSIFATYKLIHFIQDYNPDIIHLHNLHGYYINLKVLFNYLSNEYHGKIVWTFHDCWPFTGHCTYYSFVECDKWKTLCSKCIQKKEYPKSCFVDNSKNNFIQKRKYISNIASKLTIVTVSDWLKKQVQLSELEAANIKRIYNGIDTKRFHPVKSTIKEQFDLNDKYVFLCISDGWDNRKGIETVMQLSKMIDHNSAIIMIGLEEAQIADLPSNIIGIQRIWNQNKLIEFYSAADVFFNPSKEETFGLVTAEAMACGTPAIVVDSTACPEIVGDLDCGYILPKEAVKNNNLSKYFKNLYITKNEKSDNCIKRVRELFDTTAMQRNYLSLYQDILS